MQVQSRQVSGVCSWYEQDRLGEHRGARTNGSGASAGAWGVSVPRLVASRWCRSGAGASPLD